MCEFLSAIVLRNGDVLWNPYTDAHEDLIALNNLRDNREGNFARVEFNPDEPEDLDKPEQYKLRIDEGREPEWFDAALKEKTAAFLLSVVKRMVISGDATILCGGSYILAQGANVSAAKACRILVVLSGGTVQRVLSGGTVQRVLSGGTVQRVLSGGTVQHVWSGGTVQRVEDGGTVQRVEDGGTVQRVEPGGKVNI